MVVFPSSFSSFSLYFFFSLRLFGYFKWFGNNFRFPEELYPSPWPKVQRSCIHLSLMMTFYITQHDNPNQEISVGSTVPANLQTLLGFDQFSHRPSSSWPRIPPRAAHRRCCHIFPVPCPLGRRFLSLSSWSMTLTLGRTLAGDFVGRSSVWVCLVIGSL